VPLVRGSSRKAISANIATEIRHGKKPKVAAAITYRVAREAGGKIPRRRRKPA